MKDPRWTIADVEIHEQLQVDLAEAYNQLMKAFKGAEEAGVKVPSLDEEELSDHSAEL